MTALWYRKEQTNMVMMGYIKKLGEHNPERKSANIIPPWWLCSMIDCDIKYNLAKSFPP